MGKELQVYLDFESSGDGNKKSAYTHSAMSHLRAEVLLEVLQLVHDHLQRGP